MNIARLAPRWVTPELAACVVLSCIPLFLYGVAIRDRFYFPAVDTSGAFQFFSYAYGALTETGALPLWNPYALYGQPFSYWYVAISPAMHLVMWGGSLFSVENPWLLFVLAVALECFIFYYGLTVLVEDLGLGRGAALFAAFTAAMTTFWLTSFYTNFRSIYLVPLVCVYIFRFGRHLRARDLWIAGSLGVATLFGNLVYYAPLTFYLCVLFAVSAALAGNGFAIRLRSISWGRSFWPLTLLVIVVSAYVALYVIVPALETELELLKSYRTADLKLPLESFLKADFRFGWDLLELLIGVPGGIFYPNLHIGVLGFALAVAGAVLTARGLPHPALRATLVVAAAIVLFGASPWSVVARIAYQLPGMAYVNQSEVLLSILRVLLIILAAVGFSYLVDPLLRRTVLVANDRRSSTGLARAVGFSIFLVIAIAGVVLAFGRLRQPYALDGSETALFGFYLYFAAAVSAFAAWLLIATTEHWRNKTVAVALTIAAVGTLVPYFRVMHDAYDTRVPRDVAQPFMRKTPWIFGDGRDDSILTIERRIDMPKFGSNAAFFWALHQDVCRPRASMDSVSSGVALLLRAGWGASRSDLVDFLSGRGSPDRPPAARADGAHRLGCFGAKLRIATNPIIVDTVEGAAALIARDSTAQPRDVIAIQDGRLTANERSDIGGNGKATSVIVTRFEPDRVQVRVENALLQSWLVYADSFDPRWRARVNGRDVAISRANLAFKAIPLDTGPNEITLEFRDELRRLMSTVGSVFGVVLISVCLIVLFRLGNGPARHQR